MSRINWDNVGIAPLPLPPEHALHWEIEAGRAPIESSAGVSIGDLATGARVEYVGPRRQEVSVLVTESVGRIATVEATVVYDGAKSNDTFKGALIGSVSEDDTEYTEGFLSPGLIPKIRKNATRHRHLPAMMASIKVYKPS